MADPLSFLQESFGNPVIYLLLTFGYSVLVAIVLPTPIEIAFLIPLAERRYALFAEAAIVVAAGKTVGAWLVFRLGLGVEAKVRYWSDRYPIAKLVVEWLDRFVRRTGYIGLYVLLSIPLMSDTIPIYLYSLFNAEGKVMSERTFLLSNFLAALNRSAIVVLLFLGAINLTGG